MSGRMNGKLLGPGADAVEMEGMAEEVVGAGEPEGMDGATKKGLTIGCSFRVSRDGLLWVEVGM